MLALAKENLMRTIGLVEDNDCLRSVFAAYFTSSSSFCISFAVSDIEDAKKNGTICPDIILLDVDLPSGSGIDAIPELKRIFPDTKIVILSNLKDELLTKKAIQNGAFGYLLKSNSIEYIHESLMHIDNGGLPFSPETVAHLIQRKNNISDHGLTKRELEVIKYICKGKVNKQVADELHISYFTVNQHLKNIYKKLDVGCKTELVTWYLSYVK